MVIEYLEIHLTQLTTDVSNLSRGKKGLDKAVRVVFNVSLESRHSKSDPPF